MFCKLSHHPENHELAVVQADPNAEFVHSLVTAPPDFVQRRVLSIRQLQRRIGGPREIEMLERYSDTRIYVSYEYVENYIQWAHGATTGFCYADVADEQVATIRKRVCTIRCATVRLLSFRWVSYVRYYDSCISYADVAPIP